ncbi:DivIVA domain-containing protein [Embleya sp. NPDC050493]|uniref:DivIVA domain-containing protein n=1 Tax=Embleya sp. NPDC050493 TaxID=3363989 RepID=UPI0037A9195D
MFWIQLVVVTGVILVIAAVVLGAGGSLPDAHREQPELRMPGDRPLTSADVDDIRFPVVFRGYRMSEVDVVLDRLTGELAARDARILELEYKISGTTPAGITVSVPGAATVGASALGAGRLAPPPRAAGGTTLSLEKPGPAESTEPDRDAPRPVSVTAGADEGADDTRESITGGTAVQAATRPVSVAAGADEGADDTRESVAGGTAAQAVAERTGEPATGEPTAESTAEQNAEPADAATDAGTSTDETASADADAPAAPADADAPTDVATPTAEPKGDPKP